jgi:hypothetical protein
MKKYLSLIACAVIGIASANAAPVNDNFADAINLPGNSGTLSGNTTIDATFEVDEPVCFYAGTVNTVWFKWTCAADGTFTISTTGSQNATPLEWDAVVAAYTGSTLATLTQVVQQDTGTDETVTFPVTAGTTYYVQMGGYPTPPPDDAVNILLNWIWTAPPPRVMVTEPFDYNAGVYSGPWSTTLGNASGIGWGGNAWFSHAGDGLTFGIATGGHTGTFADSTGMNNLSSEWRQRNMDPAVHSNTDGDVIWQYLTMSRSGPGTAGKLTTENPNGGMQFAVRVEADGTYGLGTGQRDTYLATSAIAASQNASAPDIVVVKMVNQTGTGFFDVFMWVNPTNATEAALPAPDLQILDTAPFAGNRQIGSINWMPGNTQIDNFKLAQGYEDFGIGVVVTGPLIGVMNGIISLTDGSSAVSFGSAVAGVAVSKTLTITNEGTAVLTLGAISKDGAAAADFIVGPPGTSTLAVGGSTTFTVTFTPSTYAAETAAIHIANDSPGALNPFDIALTGTGLPPIGVRQGTSTLTDGSATPVTFGSTVVGVAVSKTFTISNQGTTILTLGAISKDGTDAADFNVGPPGTTTLAAGTSTTFSVTFTPSVAAAETAAIHIANSAAGDVNPFDIALTGTGHVLGSTIVVTEPFDYNVGVWTSEVDTGWTTTMGSGSGTGWGANEWFSHIGAGLLFGIATGGHTGTFADSTGLNNVANNWRQRSMSPAVHSNTGGDVIWQYLTVSITGTGTAGQLTTENNNGGGDFAVRVEADGTYTLAAEHQNAKTQTSTIPASRSALTPDIVVVKMENQIGTGLFDVSMWINPTAATEAGLPAPNLQILGASPFAGNRNIGDINWMPGTMQIDNFQLAGDYADFGIIPTPGFITVRLGATPLTDGSATPVSYGYYPVGAGLTKTFTIVNGGATDLTLGTISKDGADAADFTVGAPGATTLAGGSSTTFTVTFTPGTAGAKNAAIHITNSSAGALNPFDIALTGTGLTLTASEYATYISGTTPVGWWGMNETGAATTTADLSGAYGAANNGAGANLPLTYQNPGVNSVPNLAGFVSGAANRAAYFDGTSAAGAFGNSPAAYANPTGTGTIYYLTNGFAIEVWVKLDGNPATAGRFFSTREFGMGVVASTRIIQFTTFGVKDYFSTAALPNDGLWHQVGVSWDGGGAGTGTASFYIDGVPAGTATGPTNLRTALATGANSMNLSHRNTDSEHFKGWEDEVVFWDHTRSDADFATSYFAAVPPVSTLPAPKLSIAISGANVDLTWPSVYSDYTLEAVSALSGTWAAGLGTPSPVGTNLMLSLQATNTQRYFRLSK